MFALLIDFVHSKMQPTAFQATALQYVVYSTITQDERSAAARLIQIVWRYHKWHRKAKAAQVIDFVSVPFCRCLVEHSTETLVKLTGTSIICNDTFLSYTLVRFFYCFIFLLFHFHIHFRKFSENFHLVRQKN